MKLKLVKIKKANIKSTKTSKVNKKTVAKVLESDLIKSNRNLGLNWELFVLKGKTNTFKNAYDNLIEKLHNIIICNGIDLCEPNVEWIEDALNLSWFSQTAQMALTFSIEKENNKFVIHMSYLCDNKATDIYNPSNEQIVEKLKAFKFWKHIIEIKNIISETDPQKFPNTISDKKLSSEEKLEFIGEILSELRMDFSDAEHQIDCHADTLADNFRATMNALNKIRCITCLSVEEIGDMENGKS